MRSNTLCRVALALVCGLWAVGCNSAVPEPDDPYADFPAQTYPFDLVWQCSVEALEGEGLTVSNSQREGEESGTITTDYRVVAEDQLSDAEDAVRVKMRFTRQAQKSYRLEVATSTFHREYKNSDWSYTGQDKELFARLEHGLKASLRKRYRGK